MDDPILAALFEEHRLDPEAEYSDSESLFVIVDRGRSGTLDVTWQCRSGLALFRKKSPDGGPGAPSSAGEADPSTSAPDAAPALAASVAASSTPAPAQRNSLPNASLCHAFLACRPSSDD